MARFLRLLTVFAPCLMVHAVLAGEPGGFEAAVQALPPAFRNQIVRASADNGRPNPRKWYILARNAREGGLFIKDPLYSVTIRDGNVTEAKRYVDARQLLNWKNFVARSRIRVGSGEAFAITKRALGAAGAGMLSASYVLTQNGRSADPLWAVYGYGGSNRYLGEVTLSARTGSVISSKPVRLR